MRFPTTALALLYCAALSDVRAQAPTQWGALQPGSFAVGYRTIRTVDSTRRYFEAGRPLHIFVWYPAAAQRGAALMPFEGYFDDAAFDWGPRQDRVAFLRQHVRKGFQSGSLNPSFPGSLSEERFNAILRIPTRVVRDAPPASGRFPVLLHAHATGALHQSILAEYLASHGYVVLSVATYTHAPAFYGRGGETSDALLNLAEDFAFMLARAREMKNADTDRAAVIGMLAQGGLALQMKSAPLRAIACLDCLDYSTTLEQLPFFDPRTIRIPILELINSEHEDETTSQTKSYLDRFTSSTRYIGRMKGVVHPDFYPFPKLVTPGASHPRYDAIATTTLRFLDAVLKGDSASARLVASPPQMQSLPPDFLRVAITRASAMIPTELEFLEWVRYGRLDRARDALQQFGPSVVTRGRMFTTVLFLARDNEPHADSAVALLRRTFPVTPGTPEARADEFLTRILGQRPPAKP